jgi:hypothetical protein
VLIDTYTIKSWSPCRIRLNNWLTHYRGFSGSLLEFLDLDKITATDKIWVAVRALPRFEVEVFTIECALDARDTRDASEAAYFAGSYCIAARAAYRAVDPIDTAAYAADSAANIAAGTRRAARNKQVEILKYLAKGVAK